MATVLVADDEKSICEVFTDILEQEGHTVLTASNGEDAVRLVAEQHPDLVFLDVQMPVMDGLQALLKIAELNPALPVVVMTAHGTVQTALTALESGAFDYLGKPLDLPEIRQLLARALRVNNPASSATAALPASTSSGQPLGKGRQMQQIFKMMGLLTSNDLTVLVTGESGTGKELVARGIHANGKRAARPFVAVNCAAIPEHLIESELFGHEKGSFTGAVQQRIGRFEAAADGTLFLDEISELPNHLQSKLLRVLQEKSFERVGGARPIALTARIIAASNRELDQPNETNPFRQDLYHRLNLVHLKLPPLRERKEDIAQLALQFLADANVELNKQLDGIDAAGLEALSAHPWPGNVRELEHTIKRSALISPGPRLSVHDLLIDPAREPSSGSGQGFAVDLETATVRALAAIVVTGDDEGLPAPFQRIIQIVEEALLDEALKMTNGNQVAASALLGINRTTFRKKLRPG